LPDDRLIRLLAAVAVLLFVGVAVMPRTKRGYGLAKWARWGAAAIFAAAFLYALSLTVLWAVSRHP
jgi:hypothetical protein